jgi:hypothetical protein
MDSNGIFAWIDNYCATYAVAMKKRGQSILTDRSHC